MWSLLDLDISFSLSMKRQDAMRYCYASNRVLYCEPNLDCMGLRHAPSPEHVCYCRWCVELPTGSALQNEKG